MNIVPERVMDLSVEHQLVFFTARTDVIDVVLDLGKLPNLSTLLSGEKPVLLGVESFNALRAARELPPPFRGQAGSYVEMGVTPLSMPAYGSYSGRNGIPKVPRDDVVVLCSTLIGLRSAGVPLIYVDRSCSRRDARFDGDPSLLQTASWARIRKKDIKADPIDPEAVARYDAAVLIWDHVPLRAIAAAICSNDAVSERTGRIGRALDFKVITNKNYFW